MLRKLAVFLLLTSLAFGQQRRPQRPRTLDIYWIDVEPVVPKVTGRPGVRRRPRMRIRPSSSSTSSVPRLACTPQQLGEWQSRMDAHVLHVLQRAGFDPVGAGPAACIGFCWPYKREYDARGLVKRLRGANSKIGSLALMDVHGRVASTLLEMAESVDGRLMVRKLSKQDLAKLIGASREMVSRVLGNLQAQGHIEMSGTAIILKPRQPD